jgi:hypothetical protein
MDPVSSHLEKLQAAERQLLVFAREINQLYQAERARATSWSWRWIACASPTWA